MQNIFQNIQVTLEKEIIKFHVWYDKLWEVICLLVNRVVTWGSFIESKCHMSIYYKYALDGTNIFILSYFDDCVYWYTSASFGKCFVDNLGKILNVNFLEYAHWFI